MQVYRCICHSLIAGIVHYLSAGQRSNTEPATLSGFWSRQHRVHITPPNSPDHSMVAYTMCGIINSMSTRGVFKMTTNWKSIYRSFSMAWNTDTAVITSEAFHKGNVATLLRCVRNFIQVLLEISSSFQWWKNFENRLRFGIAIAKIQHPTFFWDTVY